MEKQWHAMRRQLAFRAPFSSDPREGFITRQTTETLGRKHRLGLPLLWGAHVPWCRCVCVGRSTVNHSAAIKRLQRFPIAGPQGCQMLPLLVFVGSALAPPGWPCWLRGCGGSAADGAPRVEEVVLGGLDSGRALPADVADGAAGAAVAEELLLMGVAAAAGRMGSDQNRLRRR